MTVLPNIVVKINWGKKIKESRQTQHTYIRFVVVPLNQSVGFQLLQLAKLELTC